MKLVMCAVFDSAVGAFMQPFWAQSEGSAVRGFGDAVNDPKLEFGKHPQDYTLFALATFDDQTGEVVFLQTHKRLIAAFECVPG